MSVKAPEHKRHPNPPDKDRKVFDAQEWLAAMCWHVPIREEQIVRYYGWYSNVTRGKRRERAEDGAVPYIIESAPNRIANPCFSMHNIPA